MSHLRWSLTSLCLCCVFGVLQAVLSEVHNAYTADKKGLEVIASTLRAWYTEEHPNVAPPDLPTAVTLR